MLARFVFFLVITTCLLTAFSSTGGSYSQNIKIDSLAINSTGGDYTQRLSLGFELVGTSDVNETRFGILDFVNHPPNVTALVSPLNDSISSSATVTFRFNVTDDFALSNCSLWTDETGTFAQTQINESEMSISETNNITHTFASNGAYLWNVKCFDNRVDVQQQYSDFYGTNYTLSIDESSEETSDQPDDSSASKKQLALAITKVCPDNILRINVQAGILGIDDANIKLIFSDNTFELKQEKTTDSNGTMIFNLTEEKDGEYYIEASKSGYLKAESYFDFVHCGINQTELNQTINQTEDDTEPLPEPDNTPEIPTDEPIIPPSVQENSTNSGVMNNSKPPITEPPEPAKEDWSIIILVVAGLAAASGIYYFFIHKK